MSTRRRSPETHNRKSARKAVRNLVEFKGIRRQGDRQYRRTVRHLYDGPAGAMLKVGSKICLHEPLVGRMLRSGQFDVSRFRSILDVGSGAGQILGHLVNVVDPETRLVASDLSPNMLKRARQRVKSDRPVYVAADMTRLPFADDSFECVTCGWVIEHLLDPRPGLKELCRVLKPGGSLLLLATEDTYPGALVSRTWKCRTYNRDELCEACREAGLPWEKELWFTPVHRLFRMGGILVEARKPCQPAVESVVADSHCDA